MTLSKFFKVIVVCSGHYRPLFEEQDFIDLEERGIQPVFHDATEHQWSLKLPFNGERTFYSLWQKSARLVYEEIVRAHQPILAHHVTWANGRTPTTLAGLGIPVVFGPVGGFETGCWPLTRSMGFVAIISEVLRTFLIRFASRSRSLKQIYPEFDLVLACNPESEQGIRRLGAKKVEVMSNSGVFRANVDLMQQQRRRTPRDGSCLTMLFVGRMIHWKGEELAIRAAAALPDRNWKLILVGDGQNLSNCKRMASKLGVAECVEFAGSLPQPQVWAKYAESDLFVFPSLHDSGGNAVIEAMGAGLPILCIDLGGPATYVDSSCGVRIPPGPARQVVDALMQAMNRYKNNRCLLDSHGAASNVRCLRDLTWESRCIQLVEKYEAVLTNQ